jgi:hypothetical protein
VEKDSTHGERARQFRSRLKAETMGEIDFDSLELWLDEISPILSGCRKLTDELTLLRQDYEGRITGMVKALAAADRKGRSFEDALAEIDVLPRLSAHDLVACYRRTAARFRDTFPASYGITTPYRSRATSNSV